ncbi:MAG: DNA polymerase III subunit delta [Candidatus Latescibacteria bacterium]|nr:DNA polymerase III subunit delta [Candidatus Latescibacterota bacterium]NIM21475.1 DNA polymerase III subunit delta [Candidatus Latescibacterota bacterium]NIM65646.1 DNA polymerase III subunit delta [Candidatus Latescibacterota bacterium]NIO02028.1 DNA polymerase III subunit delta [Candidatus Latescibacterota bacterium]NIO28840.1 DNA polymerase III subunit delta [Candidatus Latescibacterota bacterium]
MAKTLKDYRKLFEALRKGDVRDVYFLYGPEEYLKKEFLSEIIQAVLPERNRTFNLDIFHGDEFDKAAFDDRMRSFPLFADNRLIVLKRFEDLSTANKDWVIDRIGKFPDALVFVAESAVDKLDTVRLKAMKKTAEDRGAAIRFDHLSETETLARVKSRLSKEGLDIEQDALELLIDSVGTNLSDLLNEVEKIALNAAGSTSVTRSVVSEVVGKYRTEDLFAVRNLITRDQNVHELVRRLDRLIDAGEEPVFVLAMLLKRVVELLRIKSLAEESRRGTGSIRWLAGRMGRSEYSVEQLARQSMRFEKSDLEMLLENLRWVDFTLKTSTIDPKHLLEEAFFASFVRKKLATYANIF